MLKPTKLSKIPATTKHVAKTAFPKSSTVMDLRSAFGTLYEDEDFAALFPNDGQPAYAPWHLALVTVFQFLENLTDRQAAHAVRYLQGLFAFCKQTRADASTDKIHSVILQTYYGLA